MPKETRSQADANRKECASWDEYCLLDAIAPTRGGRGPTPVRTGDVIPGERARALGEGAVVIRNGLPGAAALTRCPLGWVDHEPYRSLPYEVLRPPFKDGASS